MKSHCDKCERLKEENERLRKDLRRLQMHIRCVDAVSDELKKHDREWWAYVEGCAAELSDD